jgi:hypothetical protein
MYLGQPWGSAHTGKDFKIIRVWKWERGLVHPTEYSSNASSQCGTSIALALWYLPLLGQLELAHAVNDIFSFAKIELAELPSTKQQRLSTIPPLDHIAILHFYEKKGI